MNKIIILAISICISVCACKPSKDETSSLKTADRKPLVTNLGNNVILPRYVALNTSVNAFDSEVQIFTAAPTIENLTSLRIKFYQAYIDWEYVACFEFGPAAASTVNLGTKTVNAFPADTAVIKNKIVQGVTAIPPTNSAMYSGFPAIDYLLFAKSLTAQQIVDSFTVSSTAVKRCNYLKTVSSDLKARINTTYTNWTASGANFISLYTNSTGIDLGSATSQTVNMLVADVENIKNFKLGIPLNIIQNVVVGDGSTVNPFKCEGYHSDSSLVLAKASIESLRKLYLGIGADGTDGEGFDNYLEAIDRSGLNVQIKNQIALLQAKLDAIPAPISIAIKNPAGKQAVNEAYTETLHLLVLLKVDMASAIGVMISYGDTDGD
ncbi:imelysin family protein [Cytophaga hutchinsonii]|uniref:Imelysin-like domain-containing protein n=1 Tax=Cytophaga hutchinsonii (strain ATCC 33406 / DSM 1761 / CIP 103989 / NBRC 15051 / NCIMB 9469 / D465) TaxID=269798 RepID=A0A6N4SNV4_CYTH3|nr:imelysin family protein [Cytophaga hutchinsonii]ABG57955.1 conserved hypothetical protein [Cytophaga hutchinsonii ATCC 33406]SFX09957.1 hypothetical protein SAMN04487930_101509 [Cytophaga hutchinsonii ATCC 33406]